MANIDPPWRLDPLKNIIDVGWNTLGFAALQFSSDAHTPGEDDEGGNNGTPVSLNPIALIVEAGASFPIFGSASSGPIARNPRPGYHKETNEHIDGQPTSSTHYEIITTYSNAGGSGSAQGDIYVTTIGPLSFWSGNPGGTDHIGGLGEAEAAILAEGWDTFSATVISSETGTSDPTDNRTVEDAGVLIINIAAVRKAMTDKNATFFTIQFDSGFSPGIFSWGASLSTHRKVKFNSFPVTDKNVPIDWPASVDDDSAGGSTDKFIRWEIDFETLEITQTSGGGGDDDG